MTTIRYIHPSGKFVEFDTDAGTITDADSPETQEAVEAVTGDVWSPAVEYPQVTLDHTTGVLCGLAVMRAAMMSANIPPTGWAAVTADGAAYVPDEADLLQPVEEAQ